MDLHILVKMKEQKRVVEVEISLILSFPRQIPAVPIADAIPPVYCKPSIFSYELVYSL